MQKENSEKILNAFEEFIPFYFMYINPAIHKGSYKGVNYSENQIKVMMVINFTPKLSPTELSTILNIQKGSLTTIIKSLINLGLLRKEYDAFDDRKYYLFLTEEGKNFVTDRNQQNVHNFSKIFSDIADHECKTIIDGFLSLKKYLQKYHLGEVNDNV
ncbi:MAG: MarR family winged helix-turn-helix transcriptional regulator [Bacillota bacterium]